LSSEVDLDEGPITVVGCQRSSNPAVFLSAVQVIQHPDVQVIPHFRGRGSTTWAP
jgi:hypothetical protein